MKILVVSHFYPPIRDGGYAQLCAEVCQGLAARGHEIHILTSRFGVGEETLSEPNIDRLLYLENDLLHYSPKHFITRWLWEEKQNSSYIQRLVHDLQPDITFIWGMYGLSRSIPFDIEQLFPEKTVYFISDLWPADPSFHEIYWNDPAESPSGKIAKSALAPAAKMMLKVNHHAPELAFRNAIIVSHMLKNKLIEHGLPFGNSTVIHSGTDVSQYFYQRSYDHLKDRSAPIRFLYAGRLVYLKGVHTILEACSILRSEFPAGQFTVNIFGDGDPEYKRQIQESIIQNKLQEIITLAGSVSHHQIADILSRHDILITPSINDDPLPRIVQEGMLSGLTVIGSDRGGIPEMIDPDVTGLLFSAGDAHELAEAIRRLVRDRTYCVELAFAGQKKALAEFDLARMVNEVDAYLAYFTPVQSRKQQPGAAARA